jgi:hypothetical protein
LTIVFVHGQKRTVAWGADARGRYLGREYYEKLSEHEQAKFGALFERLSEYQQSHNKTRFTKEIGEVYCFKSGQHRLACFFDGSRIVIVLGFRKKTNWDKRHKRELEKAVRLREEYLAGKGDTK